MCKISHHLSAALHNFFHVFHFLSFRLNDKKQKKKKQKKKELSREKMTQDIKYSTLKRFSGMKKIKIFQKVKLKKK